jgi:hypothetical protein
MNHQAPVAMNRLSHRSTSWMVCVFSIAIGFIPAYAQSPATPVESYGPYNVTSLPGGRGLTKPLEGEQFLSDWGARWSMVFWFRPSESLSGSTLLAGFGDPGSANARYVGLAGNHLILWSGREKSLRSQSELIPGAWHFAAMVCDGQSATLYADGVAAGSQEVGAAPVAPLLRFAPTGIPPAIDSHFGGQIAGLKLYRIPLTAAEIQQAFAMRPDISPAVFEDASPSWPLQTRAQAGYTAPQDPSTLPRAIASPQKPKAQPAPSGGTKLAGANPWSIQGGWKLQASPQVKESGMQISQPGYSASDWYAATVPGTVLTTLIDRGVYPDPDYGLNNLAIPESLARQSYWYRVAFEIPPQARKRTLTLTFQGINYAAEVWLNGQRLGTVTGAFLRGRFDITKLVASSGPNALAVRVSPPPHPGIPQEQSIKGGPGENGGVQVIDGPTFSATEGWDWIPGIRDRNTGIWQDVTLTANGPVEIGDLQVVTTLPNANRSEADIEIEVPLRNAHTSAVKGDVSATFDNVKITKQVNAAPGESIIRLRPEEFSALKVQNPKLWWPNGYGEPALHTLTVTFKSSGSPSDQKQINFGMRELSYEVSLFDKGGHLRRVEVLPGRTHDEALPLINETHEGIRQIDDRTPNLAAPENPPPASRPVFDGPRPSWAQSLREEAENSASVRDVGGDWVGTDLVIKVNGIRIAARGGNWGMDDSRKRVSVERLEPYFRLHRDAHLNLIRNWMGQDTEESFYALADKYGLMVWNDFWESTQDYNLEAQDPQLFLSNARVVWCGRNEGMPQPIVNEGLAELARTLDHTRYYTGSSNRVNLRNSGPYKYQALETYYRINRGFSVELGIPSVPTLESIKAWIPEPDQWPVSDTWAYHDWHQSGNGAVAPFMAHMETEFGAPTSLEDFERKAQMLDYVGHRAIFEGFAAHLWQPNSGRMLWMTQPAWPSMEWNIFSSDYDTQASYYGVQKACEPVHAQLDLTNNAVDLIDLGSAQLFHLTSQVEGLDGKVLLDQTQDVSAAANARTRVGTLDLDNLAAGHTVLVKLKVSDAGGRPVSDNLYWWSAQESSLSELNALPEATLTASASSASQDGERKVAVELTNGGATPALMIKLTLKETKTGERILPANYSENYLSLLPGETRTILIGFSGELAKPSVGIRGWNLKAEDINVNGAN